MNEMRPRKPWTALAMSLVLPGFGQLYNGEVNKAIWLFFGFAFLSVPGAVLLALYLPDGWVVPALALALLGTLGLWLYGMLDAWRGARARQEYRVRPWQLSGVYLLVLILCDLLALPALIGYVRAHLVESFYIPSHSMRPTVLRGDVLFADKRYNCPGCKGRIQRGDIAVFTYPNDRTLLYIKRIIALPGDRVQIRDGEVAVNGKPLGLVPEGVDPAATRVEAVEGHRWTTIPPSPDQSGSDLDREVPPGQVFVLGDNRPASTDSRRFGTVPMSDVVGRARQVWLSIGPEGVRWERLGAALD